MLNTDKIELLMKRLKKCERACNDTIPVIQKISTSVSDQAISIVGGNTAMLIGRSF